MAEKFFPVIIKFEQDGANRAVLDAAQKDVEKSFKPVKLHVDPGSIQQITQQSQQYARAVEFANNQASEAFSATARAAQISGDSFSDATTATLAHAQALARLQELQGDAAGAARTLQIALDCVFRANVNADSGAT